MFRYPLKNTISMATARNITPRAIVALKIMLSIPRLER